MACPPEFHELRERPQGDAAGVARWRPAGAALRVEATTVLAAGPAPAAAAPAPRKALERVLLVDDEPMIRTAVTRVMRRHCDIHAAASGEEAAGLIAAGEVFDLILVDVVMPGWSGFDFFHYLQEAAPSSADCVVFLTGCSLDPGVHRQLAETGRPRVFKPFANEELLQLLA